jgi:hypothetical protein
MVVNTPVPSPTPVVNTGANFQGNSGGQTVITPTPLSPPTPMPTPRPQVAKINDWVVLEAPPEWIVSEGANGFVISREPSLIPNTPFMEAQRWDNAVSVDDWSAWLPDAQPLPNGAYTFNTHGREWRGLFLAGEAYKAFFATSDRATAPGSYTLLFYVPVPALEVSSTGIYSEWDQWAGELGDMLGQLRIQE